MARRRGARDHGCQHQTPYEIWRGVTPAIALLFLWHDIGNLVENPEISHGSGGIRGFVMKLLAREYDKIAKPRQLAAAAWHRRNPSRP